MEPASKGQASIMDITMLLLIIIVATTFLQIYALGSAQTSTGNLKDELSDEYAAGALFALTYVSADAAAYSTVQSHALTNVSDEDLAGLVNASQEAREYIHGLDDTLENWSENITAKREEIDAQIKDTIDELSDIRKDLSGKQGQLTEGLEDLQETCTDIVADLNTYAGIMGAEKIPAEEDPCKYAGDMNSYVANTTKTLNGTIYSAEEKLSEARDALYTDTGKALDALQEARCLLSEAEIKIDSYITYAQAGIREDATLLDMLPARAGLETKSVSEAVAESLYVEDRLAYSDAARTAAATGVRTALQESGMGPDDPKSQIAQAAMLTLGRADYRSLAESSVKSALDSLLAEQGYSYCFTAETCCSRMQTGDCENKPDNSGHAKKTIHAPGNESAEMTLDLWRT